MSETIRFSGFTRDDARRWLEQRKRIRMPWHTETDPHDPINALLDLEADRMASELVTLDIASSELFWTSLQKRASAVAVGRLPDYQLARVAPAETHLLAALQSLPPSLPATVIPDGSLWGTEGDDVTPPATFEAQAAVDLVSLSLLAQWVATDAALYLGHPSMFVDVLDVSAAGYAVASVFVAEYWDAEEAGGSWVLVPVSAGLTDGTSNLSGAGTIEFDPRALFGAGDGTSRRWDKTTVAGTEGWWIRLRRTSGTGVLTTPAVAVGTDATWRTAFRVLQGETVTEDLGVTTAEDWQRFALTVHPLQDSVSRLLIGTDDTWVEVETFYLSGPADKVFVVREHQDATYILFGDGVTGAKPPSGQLLEVEYRTNADTSGNVGADTVTINRSSVPRLASVTNPAAATGWQAPEGAVSDAYPTEAQALARTRELAPATIRANSRAVNIEDYETLSVRWTSGDGRRPVSRAYAIESGAGPRSVEVLVVGPEDSTVSVVDRAALLEYFVGVRRGTQRVGGQGIQGVDTAVTAATLTPVSVTATIRVLSSLSRTAAATAAAAIEALLSPLALDPDGANWRWWPATAYSVEILQAAIVAAVPGFVRFDSFAPSSLTLGARELPVSGTHTITVIAV